MGAIVVTAETLSIGGPVDTFGFDPKEDRSTRSSTASVRAHLQTIFTAPASSSPISNWKLVGRAVPHLKKGDRSQ